MEQQYSYINYDMIDKIILHLDYNLTILLINKYFYINKKKNVVKNIIIIQKWWRKYKLPNNVPDYDLVTRKTLLRYYISKYKIEWLQKFPRHAISKLGIPVSIYDIDKYYNEPLYNVSTYMRDFCNKYMKNKTDFLYYGW